MRDDDDDFYEEDEYYVVGPLDLPLVDPINAKTISQFFIESDREERKMMYAVKNFVDDMDDRYADNALNGIINYIQHKKGWATELIFERAEVDEVLFKRYDIYDEYAWEKILDSHAMYLFRERIFKLSRIYLDNAVHEVLAMEQSRTFPKGDLQD
jgi:hypothetical protein